MKALKQQCDYGIDNELAKAQNFNELLQERSALNDEKDEYNAAMSEYENILNYDDIMCTIEIPKINVDLPVYHDSTNRKAQKAQRLWRTFGKHCPLAVQHTRCYIRSLRYPEQVFFDDRWTNCKSVIPLK